MPKSGFNHFPIGPWPAGIVNTVRADRIPITGLMDAANVNIRQDGTVRSRARWESVLQDVPAESLFKHSGRVFCRLQDDVVELDQTGATPLMSGTGPIDWTVLNDVPTFCTRQAVYQIDGQAVETLSGVELDEQDLDDHLIPLPGGHWIEYWNGRLVVARGRSLLFSEPLRYGAHNPLTGYIQLPTRVEWLAALETGIFVGQRDEVLFLNGRTPSDLSLSVVAGRSAPGMALTVESEFIGDDVAAGSPVAVFFTSSGFTVGQQNGQVVYPQKDRLQGLPLFRGKLVRDGSRIFALRGF